MRQKCSTVCRGFQRGSDENSITTVQTLQVAFLLRLSYMGDLPVAGVQGEVKVQLSEEGGGASSLFLVSETDACTSLPLEA